MKKVNILTLEIIAAAIALIGSIVNILGLFISIPAWLSILSAVLLLASSAVWLLTYLANTKAQATSAQTKSAPDEEPAAE